MTATKEDIAYVTKLLEDLDVVYLGTENRFKVDVKNNDDMNALKIRDAVQRSLDVSSMRFIGNYVKGINFQIR